MSSTSDSPLTPLDRIRGCLLGGAVGDALGAPVEFMSIGEIIATFGPAGIQEFAPAYGRLGAVTDDTQMTLFTAEGLIRAHVRSHGRGICHPPGVIHHALLRWLHTQGESSPALERPPDGWLVERSELSSRRAPGNTCLSSLRAAKRFGEEADNDSKGCGALMRIAPVGLFVDLGRVYGMACESAKSTHGHPDSTFSSGFMALVVANLMKGAALPDAISASRGALEQGPTAATVLAAIDDAVELARSDAPSIPEVVERLGQGWVAEEALAISLFCALRAVSFEQGVRLAVNHGGDSDSTGSITGQLLGALWGIESVPRRWVDRVELRDIVEQLAADLFAALNGRLMEVEPRYPGW